MSFTTLHLLFILNCSKIATQIFFVGTVKTEGGSGIKMLCSLPGVRGAPGAWDGPGRYPDEATPCPSRTAAPTSWKQQTLTGVNFFLKTAHHYPTTMALASPREEEPASQAMIRQSGPTEAITGPSKTSTLPVRLPKGPPISFHIAALRVPSSTYKDINLKVSGKEYACMEYDKTSSNWDPMVAHYLWDYLGACLVCPKCGMNFLDPSNVWCHGRELQNLPFY